MNPGDQQIILKVLFFLPIALENDLKDLYSKGFVPNNIKTQPKHIAEYISRIIIFFDYFLDLSKNHYFQATNVKIHYIINS